MLAGKRAPKPEERTVQVLSDVLEDKQSGISFSVRGLPGQAQFYGGNRRFLALRTTAAEPHIQRDSSGGDSGRMCEQ